MYHSPVKKLSWLSYGIKYTLFILAFKVSHTLKVKVRPQSSFNTGCVPAKLNHEIFYKLLMTHEYLIPFLPSGRPLLPYVFLYAEIVSLSKELITFLTKSLHSCHRYCFYQSIVVL